MVKATGSHGYHLICSTTAMIASQDALTQQIKQCSQCKISKPIQYFNKNDNKADGHRSDCKVCQQKLTQQYRESLNEKQRTAKIQRDKSIKKIKNQNIHQNLGDHLIYYIAHPAQPHLVKIGYSSSFHTRLEAFLVNSPKLDRKSTRLNSSHVSESRMPSSA